MLVGLLDHPSSISILFYSMYSSLKVALFLGVQSVNLQLLANEAEYMALSSATQEAVWWRGFRKEIESTEDNSAIMINCDNQSAIFLPKNNSYSPRTKHIDIRHHFVREKLANKEIDVKYVSTNDQIC